MYLPTDSQIEWDMLIERFELLRVLGDCPQDPIFHAEGDVLKHTRMVTEVLTGSNAWAQMDEPTQTVLFWSALLHDVAKPMCTREENGRIISPRHAIKGAQIAQDILYRQWDTSSPIAFDLRQQIVGLIRHHGLPLWFWDKSDVQRAVISASQIAHCGNVAHLATADVLGRICDDQAELLERIVLFREYCVENNCLNQPRPFASDYSRFTYFQKSNQHPDYEAYDDTQCEVVLMSGLPGAGKDTWISEYLSAYPVVALDIIRREMDIRPTGNQGVVIAEGKERAKVYLRNGQDFVWNATNTTRQMRSQLINLFTDYGARVRIVYLETPWRELLQRNQNREFGVPVKVLHKLAQRLEVPNLTEAHQVEWHMTG